MANFGGIVVGVIVFIFGYLFMRHRRNRRFWELIMKFRGDDPLPLIGNLLTYNVKSEDILPVMTEVCNRNGGSTYRMIFPTWAAVVLCDPETAQVGVVILDGKAEVVKPSLYRTIFFGLVGDGVGVSVGEKWRSRRKMAMTAFSYQKLENFLEVFNEQGDIFIEVLSKKVNKIIDCHQYFSTLTLDIICETAMGVNLDAQRNSECDYVRAIDTVTELYHKRTFSSWQRIQFLYQFTEDYKLETKMLNIINGITDKVIQSGRKALEEKSTKQANDCKDEIGSKKRTSFIDMLLTTKTPEGDLLSDKDLRDEVNTILFAGQDTSASVMAFTLYCLANNPKIQELVVEEQISIFGDDQSREVTYSDIQNMNYLEWIIKETMRLYPTTPLTPRKVVNDTVLPDGQIIPAGTTILINLFDMGRNPKYYPDPLKFDPERFRPENLKSRHPFLWITFSAGPRSCIGQKFAMLEMKAIISKVLRNFEILSAGADQSHILLPSITIRSKNGVNIELKKKCKL